MTTCKNCTGQFDDSCKFCPHCGQNKNDELTLKTLFHNTVSNYFCVDSRFFKSFIPLVVKPGFIPKRFVEGKRLTYLHPAQTYLFISVIFFFIFSFVSREQQHQMDNLLESELDEQGQVSGNQEVFLEKKRADTTARIGVFTYKRTGDSLTSGTEAEGGNYNFSFLGSDIHMDTEAMDSLLAAKAPKNEIYQEMGMPENASAFQHKVYEQTLKIYQRKGNGILQAFYDTIPITMFFLLPVFALILKLLYFQKGPFSYHLVFSFYFFSFLFLVFALLLGTNLIWEVPDWIDNLLVFSTFFYLVLGTKNFYGQGYILSFFKSGMATFLFFVFVIPITVAIMFMAALLFY